jgi:MFS family permease
VAIGTLLREHTQAVAGSFLLVVCATIAAYVALLYMPTYAKTQLALPLPDAFEAQMLALTWMILLIPLFGSLSDRIGRRPVLIAATLGNLLLPYLMFAWVQVEPSFVRLLGLQVVMCSVVAMLFGPLSTVLAEQFPAAVRSTGMAIAYNFAVTLFGGFAPFIVTWLIRETGSRSAPAFYIMFGAAAGIAGTLLLREGRHPVFTGSRLITREDIHEHGLRNDPGPERAAGSSGAPMYRGVSRPRSRNGSPREPSQDFCARLSKGSPNDPRTQPGYR